MSTQPLIGRQVSLEDDPELPIASPGAMAGNLGTIQQELELEPEPEQPTAAGKATGAGRGGASTAGVVANPNRNPTGNKIVDEAMKYIGLPYVWGGTGPRGVDCSGLVQLAAKAGGFNLPRVSFQQARSGQRINLDQLQPGDLVAWDNSARNPGADHIAIYAGNGMIIEAPRPGTNVRMRKLGGNERAWGVRL